MRKLSACIYRLMFGSDLGEDRRQYQYFLENIQSFEFSDTHLRVCNPNFGEESFHAEAEALQKALKK